MNASYSDAVQLLSSGSADIVTARALEQWDEEQELIDHLARQKAERMVDVCAWRAARYLAGLTFEQQPGDVPAALDEFAERLRAIAEAAR